MWFVFLCFIVGLCASLLTALSYSLNKRAFALAKLAGIPIFKSKLWVCATALLVLGTAMGLGPMAVLGQTTNTSLSCVTIISSALFARIILK